MAWATRVINDFEIAAPAKSTPPKKKDSQALPDELGDQMDRACLHTWLLSSDSNTARVLKMLNGPKLDKYKQLWTKGHPRYENETRSGSFGLQPRPLDPPGQAHVATARLMPH